MRIIDFRGSLENKSDGIVRFIFNFFGRKVRGQGGFKGVVGVSKQKIILGWQEFLFFVQKYTKNRD